MQDLKVGDRVQFDIEGKKEAGPHGFGRVSRVQGSVVIVLPDRPLSGNIRMLNISKVEVSK